MQVNPDELRALAASMDKISVDISALKVQSKTNAAKEALPGSTLGEACAAAGDQVEAAWLQMAMCCTRVSNIAKGGAANYEVTDKDFSDGLQAMGGAQ
ncbi:type VII secretion target [Nocardia sp. NPDC049707]|uniref:type VII secretion target n=1 Tax=Nocardia sp. NPDC049707 TaxID=3154735 RepID=UPI00341249F8